MCCLVNIGAKRNMLGFALSISYTFSIYFHDIVSKPEGFFLEFSNF